MISKKRIAKEILILFFSSLTVLLLYIGLNTYNSIRFNQKKRINKITAECLSSLDSLTKQHKTIDFSYDLYNFLRINNKTSNEYIDFISSDSLEWVYNFLLENDLLSNVSKLIGEKGFYKRYFNEDSLDLYKPEIQLVNDYSKKINLNEIELESLEESIFSNEQMNGTIIAFIIILLMIIYPLRILFFIILWAFKTLREE